MLLLSASRVLIALRTLHCNYRPDTSVTDGAWIATCPSCHLPGALAITEIRPVEVDDEHPPVRVGCRARCAPPRELAELLLRDPATLALERERDAWRARAAWALDSWQRHIALTSHPADQHPHARDDGDRAQPHDRAPAAGPCVGAADRLERREASDVGPATMLPTSAIPPGGGRAQLRAELAQRLREELEAGR
jgi:hypothetical protein